MKRKQLPALFIVLLFGGSFLAYALSYSTPTSQNKMRERGAYIQIITCGERRELPQVQKSKNNMTFTSNTTGLITFSGKEELTLGEAFNLMNLSFSDKELMGYEGSNGCNTTYSNEVTVWTGQSLQDLKEVNQYEGYIINSGDVISVRYM